MDEQQKSQISYDEMPERARRHIASFAASIAAHAAIIGLIVCFVSPIARGHSEWVLAYLVEVGDGVSGRGGARAAASEGSSLHATTRAHPAAREARPRGARPATEVASLSPVHSVARARPSASAREPTTAPGAAVDSRSGGGIAAAGTAAVGFAGRGGADADAGAGSGAGGDPDSIAHADYASNPPPTYPATARRREQQGTVTVRVLVGVDGSVESAEIEDSSGFDALDVAALQTVRLRWRFVPARHGGVAVESWVLVPIRFALVEADVVR